MIGHPFFLILFSAIGRIRHGELVSTGPDVMLI